MNDSLITQNEFLSVWVSYQVQRINLDLEMGTMQLDERGVWLDPGPISGGVVVPNDVPEEPIPPAAVGPELPNVENLPPPNPGETRPIGTLPPAPPATM